MIIKNIREYRQYYKEIEDGTDSPKMDIDFIGAKVEDRNRKITKIGFFQMFYSSTDTGGERKSLESNALNIAADHQAIYELVQNADDAQSTMVFISITEDYLLCINNGAPFKYEKFDKRTNEKNQGRVASILRFGQSDKGIEDIGTFGIGFKIIHRLLGEGDGADEIINQYKGPIIFSWSKYVQLQQFLNDNEVLPNLDRSINSSDDFPWLFKILYTCFPVAPFEKVNGKGLNLITPFDNHELSKFRADVRNEILSRDTFTKDNLLRQGSIFYIPLGKNKLNTIKSNLAMLEKGVSFSFNFLKKKLSRIYFQGNKIDKSEINTKLFKIEVGTDEFIKIKPKVEERDIEAQFAYYDNYKESESLVKQDDLTPNLYNYFAMEEEVHKFRFLVHCNAFEMTSDRRKLQPDSSQINYNLLKILAEKISVFILSQKELNQNLYLNLFAAVVLSPKSDDSKLINPYFYDPLTSGVFNHIPTKSNTYQSDATKIKIKNTTLNIELSDFGFENYHWYYWSDETDADLISRSEEVLGLEKWDLKNIIEESESININTFLQSKKVDTPSFLKEVCKSPTVRDKVKTKLIDEVSFITFGEEFLSISEIIEKENYLLCLDSIVTIEPLLEQIGFSISDINFSLAAYKPLLEEITSKYLSEANVFKRIKSKLEEVPERIENQISEDLKVAVFNAITDDPSGCIFGKIGPEEIKKLEIFKNQKEEIVTLDKLICPKLEVSKWLSGFQPKADGIVAETHFIKEAAIYGNVIIPNWEKIISNIDQGSLSEFCEQVKYYYDLAPPESKVSLMSNHRVYLPILKKTDFISNNFQLQWVNNSHDIFFNKKFSTIGDYPRFVSLLSCISTQPLPAKEIFDYINEPPFETNEKGLTNTSLIECSTLVELTDLALVLSYESSSIWDYYSLIAQDGKWWLSYQIVDNLTLQLASNSKLVDLDKTLLSELSFTLSFLPLLLSEYDKDVDSDEKVIDRIIDETDLSTHLATLLRLNLSQSNFEKIIGQNGFLIELDNSETYTLESDEYLLFKWFEEFCNKESSQSITNFKNSIRVKIGEDCKSIPTDLPESDDLKFGEEVFALSKILPNRYAFTGVLNKIKEQFTNLKLLVNPINHVFGLSSQKVEKDTLSIFNLVGDELTDNQIESTEQLKFITSYLNSNANAPNDFKIKVLGEAEYVELNSCDFVLKNSGIFTDLNKVIDGQKYNGFFDWFKNKNKNKGKRKMSVGTSASISVEPRVNSNEISLVGIKAILEKDEEKTALLNYFFDKWDKIPSVQNNLNTENIAKLSEKVGLLETSYYYPNKYANEDLERLPNHVATWIEKNVATKDSKLKYLSVFGVYAKDAPELHIRSFLLGEIELDTAILKKINYQDAISAIGFVLTKTDITFEKTNRQESLHKLIEHINDTLPKDEEENKFLWEYAPDFESIINSSKSLENEVFVQWKKSTGADINILVYSDSHLPEFVSTNKTGNNKFYTRFERTLIHKEGTNDVYISSNRAEDVEGVLSELNKSGFPNLNLIAYRDIKYKTNSGQNDVEEFDDSFIDSKILETLNKDIPKEVQQSENYSSLIFVLGYLRELKWKNIEDALIDKTTISCIQNSEGKEMKVVVRSGKQGIFYLRDFNWSDNLQDDNTILAIVLGDKFSDIEFVYNQEDLLEKFVKEDNQIKYHILRIPKSVDLATLNSIAEQLSKSENGGSQFLFKSKNNSEYISIFSDGLKNTIQVPNETSPGSEENLPM